MIPTFFMHIPRCGGTTFEYALNSCFRKPAPRFSWTEEPGLPERDLSGFDLIVGHYPYAFTDRFEQVHTVALVRNPVLRVLSHYHYVHVHGYWRDLEYTAFCQQATLTEWLSDPRAERSASNLMTRFFAGDRESDDVERALWNMRKCAVVQPIDVDNGIQVALDRICKLAKKPTLKINGRDNAAPERYTPPQRSVIDRIAAMNQQDMQLYLAVCEQEGVGV